MQRLFSSFPGGLPGLGLLLLRFAVGGVLLLEGYLSWTTLQQDAWAVATGVLIVVTGLALLAGALTPLACIAAQAVSIGVALSILPLPIFGTPEGRPATLLIFIIAVAILLLGPGAFSLDARLFGRREVVIPR